MVGNSHPFFIMKDEEIETVEISVWQHACGHNQFFISMNSEIYCTGCLQKIRFWAVVNTVNSLEDLANDTQH